MFVKLYVFYNLYDFQKLYQKYSALQKLVNQLREDIKVKNKTILDLQAKLNEKVSLSYNKNLEEGAVNFETP